MMPDSWRAHNGMTKLPSDVRWLINCETGFQTAPFVQRVMFQLDKAVASSALFQPNHDDVPIIQAPHSCRNYQI